ncbi:MAG: hypothetical protein A3K10_09115 [Bacteroidetes bacterium RIFCSPLOWO2_12_FULL_31_6]|nr:MAG: hypothetical protein A3K10_09115 [Bacteroidetes bacterium RIFCSPLOWO2_12_FULL_31_6]
MTTNIKRELFSEIKKHQKNIPAIAIVGARQVGKTTLAKELVAENENTLFLDLEKSSDREMIKETEAFLNLHKGKTICFDEVQMMPDLFLSLRNFIDNNSDTKFILLGSASPELLRQTAESLAGRIYYFELSPFLWTEIKQKTDLKTYQLRGGMPLSILAKTNEDAFIWLQNFIKTFLERDLRNFGFNIPPTTLNRLWTMLAHINGQVLNYSQLANSMGVSHTTINNYISILENTFMLRILQPYHNNIKKRLIKAPKIYFRDTGILHSLLQLENFEDLYTHPVYGTSWEVTVIENIIHKFKNWNYYYYRTSNGSEIDLILTRGNKKIAIEIKASSIPKVTVGFWNALEDLKVDKAYIIAQVSMPYPLKNKVMVYPLDEFLTLEND